MAKQQKQFSKLYHTFIYKYSFQDPPINVRTYVFCSLDYKYCIYEILKFFDEILKIKNIKVLIRIKLILNSYVLNKKKLSQKEGTDHHNFICT